MSGAERTASALNKVSTAELDLMSVVIGYGHALATPLLRYSQILIEVIMVSVFVHSSKEAGACPRTWSILSSGIIDSAGKKEEKNLGAALCPIFLYRVTYYVRMCIHECIIAEASSSVRVS